MSMNTPLIRWGIIGCGDVTEVKSGPAFNKVPHSKLVAVMRRSAAKAKNYAERHGVPKWYSDATELINDPDVDAVYVATPPLQHESYTLQALQAGKPVYVEKPMALNAESALRMTQAAKATGAKLSVAHYRRQQPLFLKIKTLLEERRIGEVRHVNLQLFQPHKSNRVAKTEEPWRTNPAVSGGGLFHDLAPHQLDLMLHFFGAPLLATGLSQNAAGLYDPDDTVCGQIQFSNNVLFSGAWGFTLHERRDVCEIIGSEGSLRFSVFDQHPLVLKVGESEEQFSFDRLTHVQQPLIAKVVEHFLGRGPNPSPAEEGVLVMKMMEALTAKGQGINFSA